MSYTLNFSNGRKITDVIKDDKIIGSAYLYDENYKCNEKCNRKCCNYHPSKMNLSKAEHIVADDKTTFMPAFNNLKNQISIFYITGQQGCGKSVLASNLIRNFRNENKKMPVLCISECKVDDVLDKYLHKKITPQEVKDDNLNFEDFQDIANEKGGMLILFDDIDSINDAKPDKLKSCVYQLLNSLINNSRKYNINIIYTTHRPCEGNYSKAILNSCSNWIYFTNNITNNVRLCMKNYMGLSKENETILLNLKNTRWVSVNRTLPMSITSEKECFILG
jgi:hypothetical protein